MDYRKRIDELLAERSVQFGELRSTITKMEIEDEQLNLHEEARQIIQKAAQITQKNLEEYVSNIVTKAIGIVFLDEAKEFVVEFVTRRNSLECDLWFKEGGALLDPLDSCGFGEADVASFALRIAYWSLGNSRNTLLVDEPMRNLDGDRVDRASEMVKVLSDELNLQIILVTHEDALEEMADKKFKVLRTRKVSNVKEI